MSVPVMAVMPEIPVRAEMPEDSVMTVIAARMVTMVIASEMHDGRNAKHAPRSGIDPSVADRRDVFNDRGVIGNLRGPSNRSRVGVSVTHL